MNVAKILTPGAALLGTAGPAPGQGLMFSTLPTAGGQSFNPDASITIRGPAAASGPEVASGHLFTAQATGGVYLIRTAVRHLEGDNTYTLQVRHGDAAHVGAIIFQTPVWGRGGPFPFTGAWTEGTPVLNAGQTYWVTLIGHGSAHGAWHLNTQGVAGQSAQSTDGGATFLPAGPSPLPAIRMTAEDYPFCLADWNYDGLVNSLDISAYISTWVYSVTNGTLEADINGCGCVNSQQISAFITAWIAEIQPGGC
jgi:hypothetical protein